MNVGRVRRVGKPFITPHIPSAMSFEMIFWGTLFVLFYTYLGYGLIIAIWAGAKSSSDTPGSTLDEQDLPSVTLLIAAYNEKDILASKAENIDALIYPSDKLDILFVTDGSTDGTQDWLRSNTTYRVMHASGRRGKTAALNRAMKAIASDIVVFTDANTLLHPESIKRLVQPYADTAVGAVSGEKRVGLKDTRKAHGAGEGLYWRYESKLKDLDYKVHTVVGAAGELFSIRRSLYVPVAEDVILDDFMITLGIVEKGYRVAYVKEAYALEAPSASLAEEMKRKVRICAGGFQSMVRLRGLLNPVRQPVAWFQYISHRVLRWAVAPFMLPIFLIANLALIPQHPVYLLLALGHVLFYAMALYGWVTRDRNARKGWLFTPLYFVMMNVAAYLGLWRSIRGTQSAAWVRSVRAA